MHRKIIKFTNRKRKKLKHSNVHIFIKLCIHKRHLKKSFCIQNKKTKKKVK